MKTTKLLIAVLMATTLLDQSGMAMSTKKRNTLIIGSVSAAFLAGVLVYVGMGRAKKVVKLEASTQLPAASTQQPEAKPAASTQQPEAKPAASITATSQATKALEAKRKLAIQNVNNIEFFDKRTEVIEAIPRLSAEQLDQINALEIGTIAGTLTPKATKQLIRQIAGVPEKSKK